MGSTSPAKVLKINLDPVAEVHLKMPPLEKVLADVRFSQTPELISDEVEQLISSYLKRYPVRRKVQSVRLNVNPVSSSVSQESVVVRTFSDTENSWVITLSAFSVGISTTSYHSRDDFCERAYEVFEAVDLVGKPPIVDRVGMRYINRITDPSHLSRLDDYVEPRLRVLDGIVDGDTPIEYSVSNSLIQISDSERLKVQSGVLPPSVTFDPAFTPVDAKSWILDSDVFTIGGQILFEPQALKERLERYSTHAYSVFRWATTAALLEAFSKG